MVARSLRINSAFPLDPDTLRKLPNTVFLALYHCRYPPSTLMKMGVLIDAERSLASANQGQDLLHLASIFYFGTDHRLLLENATDVL